MEYKLDPSKLVNKSFPFIKLLLMVKNSTFQSVFFYLFLLILKLLGIVIITNSFIYDSPLYDLYSMKIANTLRRFTSFGLLNGITLRTYGISSVALFLLELLFLFSTYSLYKKIEKREEPLKNTNGIKFNEILITFFFNILLILSQHLLEYFSFIFVIITNSTETNFNLFNQFSKGNYSKGEAIFYAIVNTCSIIFINVFFYYSIKVLNEPYFKSNFPINIRTNKHFTTIFIFISNLQAIHYLELFIKQSSILFGFKIGIILLINCSLVFEYLRNIHTFKFKNLLNSISYFVLIFTFFSSLLELITSITNNKVSNENQLLYLNMTKLLFSVSFYLLDFYLKNYLMMKRCKNILFKIYGQKMSNNEKESFYYLIDILLNIRKGETKYYSKVVNMILAHKNQCGMEFCRCNIINNFKNVNLIDQINFIIESIFTSVDIEREKDVNVLFAEYLFKIKKFTLFSYAMLNTFMNKNFKVLSNLEIYHIYILYFLTIKEFDKDLIATSEFVNFIETFQSISIMKFYNKHLIKVTENFEVVINFKDLFDSSMKFDPTETSLDSNVFNSIGNLVDSCIKHRNFYKEIKSYIRRDFSNLKCKSIELTYKLYIFFMLVNKKIPKSITTFISINSENIIDNNFRVTQTYFNKMLKKYFSDGKSAMNIIIEINNSFKIKYFSYLLSKILGWERSKLINEDMHILFPEQIRDNHKKVLLNQFLIKKQIYFAKKTFAFTKSNHILPVFLKVSVFPNLRKNLQAIVSIKPLQQDSTEYNFVLGNNFELLALSQSIDKKFSLNYELMDKLNINVLKIFELGDLMKKKFQKQLENVEKSRQEKMVETLYSLSNYLFNMKFYDEINVAVAKNKNDRANGEQITAKLNLDKNKNNLSSNKAKPDESEANLHNTNNQIYTIESQNSFNNTTRSNANGDLNSISNRASLIEKTKTKKSGFLLNKTAYNLVSQDEINNTGMEANNDDTFIVTREKKIVIRNLEKIRNRCMDMRIGQLYYNKISESVRLFQKSAGIIEIESNRVQGQNEQTGQSNDFLKVINLYARQNTKQINEECCENFTIKLNFRKINDLPFYIVSLSDEILNFNKVNNKKKLNLYKMISKKKENDKYPDTSKSLDRIKKFKFSENQKNYHKNGIGEIEDSQNSYNPSNPSYSSNLKNHLTMIGVSTINKSLNILEDENKEKAHKKYTNRIIVILVIFFIFKLAAALGIYYYSDFSLQGLSDLLYTSYISNYQASSFSYLYSGVLSLILKVNNLTTFDSKFLNNKGLYLNTNELQDLLLERINKYRENFAIFHEILKKSKQRMEDVEGLIYNYNSFSKIILTWDNIQSMNTIPDMVNYICSHSKILAAENEFTNLIYDLENGILMQKYKSLTNKSLLSIHTAIVYFLHVNSIHKISDINKKIIDSINVHVERINGFWSSSVIPLSISLIILSIIILGLVYHLLKQYDKSIFNYILIMFLNMKRNDEIPFKTPLETKNLKKKILNYRLLISNFTILTIKNMDESLNALPKNKTLKYQFDENRNKLTFNPIQDKNIIKENYNAENNNENSISPANDAEIITTNNLEKNGIKDSLKTTFINNIIINNSVNDNLNSSAVRLNNNNFNINTLEMNRYNSNYDPRTVESIKKPKLKMDFNNETPKANPYSNDNFITNSQILSSTKHHQITLIKVLNSLVILIFVLSILFMILDLILNSLQYNSLIENNKLGSNLIKAYPLIINLFNTLRGMIIDNNSANSEVYLSYLNDFEISNDDYVKLFNTQNNDLPTTYALMKNINNNENLNNGQSMICLNKKNNTSINLCKNIINNQFNSKGIYLSSKSVTQIMNNIYKDFIILKQNKKEFTRNNIYKYFNTDEFANINLQIEYVFDDLNSRYIDCVINDVQSLIINFRKSILILSVVKLIFDFLIILLLFFGIFNKLKYVWISISYTSKKFNRCIFD